MVGERRKGEREGCALCTLGIARVQKDDGVKEKKTLVFHFFADCVYLCFIYIFYIVFVFSFSSLYQHPPVTHACSHTRA